MDEPASATKRVFPPPGEKAPPACDHDTVRQLGVDAGQNQYLRCRDCEAVIVAFSATAEWQDQREALSTEPREWNPLVDALRTKRSGPQADPRRENSRRETPGTLTARVRQTWRAFWSDR